MIPAGMVERGERKRTTSEVSKTVQTMSKPGVGYSSGISPGADLNAAWAASGM